ncbi:MAG: PAS domain S-box protein [Mariprofundaceae bacterium]|nr:PAS domain S-box protein [Mariprofundaceae bacterium]
MTESARAWSRLSQIIIEASLDAIVCINEQGNIILWNPAAERMFGYSRKKALGMPVTELLAEEDRARHEEAIRQFIETGKEHLIGNVTETLGRRRDGSTFVKEMSLSADRLDGEWVFVAIMRDVTGRKQTEESLREKLDEIEHMNRLMIGRELKMEELRQDIRKLKEKLAGPPGEKQQ